MVGGAGFWGRNSIRNVITPNPNAAARTQRNETKTRRNRCMPVFTLPARIVPARNIDSRAREVQLLVVIVFGPGAGNLAGSIPVTFSMKYSPRFSRVLIIAGLAMLAGDGFAQPASATKPYKVVNTTQTMGTGGIDYVFADNDGRRLYVPRGGEVLVFDLDTLKSVGSIPNAR